jgi:hypothetical protein
MTIRKTQSIWKSGPERFRLRCRGDQNRCHDAQPNIYRSPEVMLRVDWSYPVDIWNVGVMVRLSDPAINAFVLAKDLPNSRVRFGICLRESTCFVATTPRERDT